MARSMGIAGILLAGMAIPAHAQDMPANPVPTPSVLTNSGKPMLLPFQCADEDIRWAGMSCSEDAPCPVFNVRGVDRAPGARSGLAKEKTKKEKRAHIG